MISAKPDGYTLAVVTVEVVILPHLNLFNRTYEDVTPIAQLNADPAALVVRSDSPINSLEDLMTVARKEPGKMNMGNASTFNQPMKFTPSCPCFKFFAPNTLCTIL